MWPYHWLLDFGFQLLLCVVFKSINSHVLLKPAFFPPGQHSDQAHTPSLMGISTLLLAQVGKTWADFQLQQSKEISANWAWVKSTQLVCYALIISVSCSLRYCLAHLGLMNRSQCVESGLDAHKSISWQKNAEQWGAKSESVKIPGVSPGLSQITGHQWSAYTSESH